MNSRFCSKTRWQMFLLVSVRHVGAHPNGHHHAVFMQISINLGKTFLRISSIWNIALTWILARVFAYLPPFIFQILDLICWTVLIFISIYFEWRETENQQYGCTFILLRGSVSEIKNLLSPLLRFPFRFYNTEHMRYWPHLIIYRPISFLEFLWREREREGRCVHKRKKN